MKNILHYFVLILIFCTNFSCTNANEDNLTENFPEPDLVTYSEHIKPVVDNNCLLCHSNPPQNGAPMHLTTYGAVKGAVENLNLIARIDRKSTRLNSSHVKISYAVFCLKKKKL